MEEGGEDHFMKPMNFISNQNKTRTKNLCLEEAVVEVAAPVDPAATMVKVAPTPEQ